MRSIDLHVTLIWLISLPCDIESADFWIRIPALDKNMLIELNSDSLIPTPNASEVKTTRIEG